jgi:hypothetical protein
MREATNVLISGVAHSEDAADGSRAGQRIARQL